MGTLIRNMLNPPAILAVGQVWGLGTVEVIITDTTKFQELGVVRCTALTRIDNISPRADVDILITPAELEGLTSNRVAVMLTNSPISVLDLILYKGQVDEKCALRICSAARKRFQTDSTAFSTKEYTELQLAQIGELISELHPWRENAVYLHEQREEKDAT